MVALVGVALAVDDAGVAGLTGGIEAPVVELGDHLALGDLGVEAAGGVGAGVLGVLVGQGGEGVLGGLAILPLGQHVLGLGHGLVLEGLEVSLIGLGLGVQGAVVDRKQNVTHVHRVVLIPEAAAEGDHIVGRTGLILHHGGVAGLAGRIEQPLAQSVGEISHAGGVGVVGILVGLRQGLQALTGLEGGVHGVGLFLGLGHGVGLHLVGDLHGVAVGIGGGHGAADAHALIGHLVIGIGIFIVGGSEVVQGIGQAVAVFGSVSLGQHGGFQLLGEDALRHQAAIGHGQIMIEGGVVAGGGHVVLQRLHGAVQFRLQLVRPGEAIGGRVIVEGLDGGHLLEGLIQEVVEPGLAVFAAGISLVPQILRGVQAQEAEVVGVLAPKALVYLLEVVIDFSGGVLFIPDGNSGSTLLDDLGLPGQGDNGHDDERHRDGSIDHVAALFRLALLCFAGGLGIGPVYAGRSLTGLLFS